MHTNETLSKLSEHEINILVADISGQEYIKKVCFFSGDKWIEKDQDETLDYCQNPDDIWTIATENKINSFWYCSGKIWTSDIGTTDIYLYARNDNRLRAICELIILMNQGE